MRYRIFLPGLLVIVVLAMLTFSAGCAMPAGDINAINMPPQKPPAPDVRHQELPALASGSSLLISRYERSGSTVFVTGTLYLNLTNPGREGVYSIRPCVDIVPIHPVDTGIYQKEYCYPLSDIPPGTSINLSQPVNLSLPESALLEIQNDQTGVNLIVKVPGYAVSGHP